MWLNWSRAVTVNVRAWPAVMLPVAALTVKCVAGGWLTAIAVLPLMLASA